MFMLLKDIPQSVEHITVEMADCSGTDERRRKAQVRLNSHKAYLFNHKHVLPLFFF